MTYDINRHHALVRMHDRAYHAVIQILESEGFKLPESGKDGYAWARLASEGGDARAMFCVAKLASAGIYTEENKAYALEMCREAARKHFPAALTLLGNALISGWEGNPVDVAGAVQLFEKAALLGESGALHSLAVLNLQGRIGGADPKAGRKLLLVAAERGDPISQFELGLLLIDADDPAEEMEGLKWIKESANNGIATSHRLLGHYYRRGEHGLPLDSRLAGVHESLAANLESQFL